MSLMDAPAFDSRRSNRNRNLLLGAFIAFVLLILLTLAGFISGHGWLFTNLGYEHRVNNFFNALEARDYPKAYDIYQNGHPDSGYPLKRFTEDWTVDSPVHGPITEHHIDISKTDGTGTFGTGVIVAARVNGDHKVFMYVNKADGTMTWPAPHELGYTPR